MTIDSKRPAFGPANVDRRIEPDSAQESDRRERSRIHSTWSSGDIEETDLERRVLAHERILQALIAHMAEAEPKFVAHLSAVFSELPHGGRREHDFTDTHAYADQFVRKVLQIVEHRGEPVPIRALASRHPTDLGQGKRADTPPKGCPVTRLEVRRSTGLWQVTCDGQFHGHYDTDQPAFDAAEAVALDVVANGGAADLWWNDRPQSEESDPGMGVAARGVSRTIEFRSGSTRIVR